MNDFKFICAHKDFELPEHPYVNKDQYTVITPNPIKCPFNQINYEETLDNRLWSEWSAIKYVRDNIDSEWYGVNHYRRISEEYNNHIGYAQELRLNMPNVQQYSMCHNVDDLNIAATYIRDKYPNFFNYFINMSRSILLVPYNIVYFPKNIFNTWVDLVVDICQNVLDYHGIKTYEDMLKHIETNHDKYIDGKDGQNGTVSYQARMVSFLSERITTAFIAHLRDQLTCYPLHVKLLEKNQTI